MSDDQKMLERIQLLLNKAESTTPEEAQALREHAERLAVRHGIDQARIEAERTGQSIRRENIVWSKHVFSKAYFNRVESNFWSRIANGIGEVRCYRTVLSQTSRRFSMVGYESDVARVEMLAASLWLQAQTALDAWWKSPETRFDRRYQWTPNERLTVRGAFLDNFAYAAAERLRAQRKEALDEVKGTGTDLVLASRLAQVDEECGWGSARKARRTSFHANQAGYRAGQKASLGGNEVSGGRVSIEK